MHQRSLMKRDELLEHLRETHVVYVLVHYRHDDFCEMEISKTVARQMFEDLPEEMKIRAFYHAFVLRIG